jgi:hypothetical protein
VIAAVANVSTGRYALGFLCLLIVCGSLGLAAAVLRCRLLPGWRGARARLAEVVIGSASLIGILELLGAIGLFRLAPIVAASVLFGAATAWALRSPGLTGIALRGEASRRRALGLGSITVIALCATTVIAEWACPTLESYDVGIRTLDSLWYHLPWAASFAQTGHITPLRFTDVEYLTAFYPATAELLHGLGIVLLARDTLSPEINLVWLGLVLLAAYCIGRPRGRAPATVLGAALATATPMFCFSQAGSAANDVVGVFFLLAAVALVADAGNARAAFVLAAIAAGLAISVKLSLLAPVLALTLGAIATAPSGRRLAASTWWLGSLFVAGGFWYVRNLVAVGNPLPWESFGIFPTPKPPLQEHTASSVVHYLTSTRLWSTVFEPGLASGLGPWWAVILAGVVLGPALCLLPGAGRTVRMLGMVALASLGAYLLTPETAAGPPGDPLGFAFNLRYAAPALTLSLTVLPLAPVLRGARRQAATIGCLAVVLVATIAQASLWPAQHVPGAVGLGLAVAVAGLLIWVLRDRAAIRLVRAAVAAPGRAGRALVAAPGRILTLAIVALLLLAGAAGGYALQRHYLRGRYAFGPGVSYLAKVWALFRHVRDSRVAVVGTFGGFFSYPLYGPDESNRVQYVARRGPRGSFTTITGCPQWRAAVNAGHFRYVVATPGRDPWHPKPLRQSPEGTWTASDPAARLLYTRRATGQVISVFELHGPLDPALCPKRQRSATSGHRTLQVRTLTAPASDAYNSHG